MKKADIESMLRAGPPDEPAYTPRIATRLAARGDEEPSDENAPLEIVPHGIHAARRLTLVAAAAAVLIIVAGLLSLTQLRSSPASVPTSTPPDESLASTVPPAVVDDPTLLRDRWIGEPRQIAGVATATGAVVVEVDADEVLLLHTGDADNPSAFGSEVAVDGDQLVLTLISTDRGCEKGAVGRYRWDVSADGARLTLAVVDDECTSRTVISGTYTHTACPQPGQDCLGPVPAGEYGSVTFDVLGTHAYGQLRYTLPEGWSVTDDTSHHVQLRPTAPSAERVVRIDVWADPVLTSCARAAERASSTLAGRPTEVFTMDGDSICPDGVLVAGPAAPTAWSVPVEPGRRMRVHLVDLGNGHTVAVSIVGDSATFDDDAAAVEAIVESFQFSSGSS